MRITSFPSFYYFLCPYKVNPFETVIIERYRRREASVEESLVEMYIAGVSVKRVEDITQALWGTRVSPQSVSNLNKKIYSRIDEWRTRKLTCNYPYVYLDGIWLKRSWGGEVKNVSVLVALGVNEYGYREVIGIAEGAKEDKDSWSGFLLQSERARADRSEALHFRQEPRPCGNHTRLLPRSGMAALHGAFLQKT